MIRVGEDNFSIVGTPAEVWVTDEISIKFKEPVHIRAEDTLAVAQILEKASNILRTLELVKR